MATDCSINELHTFLKNPDQQRLVIQFSTLHIKTFQHGECLQNVLLPDRRLRLVKTQDPARLRVQVLDNLVFRFSFVFSTASFLEGNKISAQKLPRPLEKGWIQLHKDAVHLGFWIDGPDPDLRVYVEQVYFG